MWRSRPRVEVPSLAEAEADPTAQRFRAGNIEIIATSGPGPQQGPSPVIEIDLNLRRRQRADTEPAREPEEDPPVEMVSQTGSVVHILAFFTGLSLLYFRCKSQVYKIPVQ